MLRPGRPTGCANCSLACASFSNHTTTPNTEGELLGAPLSVFSRVRFLLGWLKRGWNSLHIRLTHETTKSRALASNKNGVVVVQPSLAWAIATLFFPVR